MKLLLILAPLFLVPMTLRGAGRGDEVIVVFNNRLPESKAVADYYAEKRQVPKNQIFGFDLPTNENMTRAEFRDSLQRPLAAQLEKRKLWHIASQIISKTTNQPGRVEWKVAESKIRYAALAYGVPLRILHDANLKEEGVEKIRPEMQRNGASVDTELAFLPLVEENLPLTGPLRNPLYTATNVAWFHPTNGVLMVARLDGPTPQIARGLVDKALLAEEHGLWGRAYVDLRKTSDPAYKLGDDMLRGAAEICRHAGFETVVDDSPATFAVGFPMSQIAVYAGWYTEHVSGPFTLAKVEFMPGAFAYHLHSFSANTLRSAERHWVGPLLAKGATITMGCIDEPYLTGTPDIAVFVARLLVSGFTFAEAAYACQPVLSWQSTFVGDPLYRPCSRNPDELVKELERRKDKLVEWAYLRLIDLYQANGQPVAKLVTLLERPEISKQSAVLNEKLGDLYGAQGKPSSAVHAYEQALKLNPSPQQRIRLDLALGERLLALNRDADAYDNYQALLQDVPDYPDKPAVLQKLLLLAQKLGKKEDAEKYETELKK